MIVDRAGRCLKALKEQLQSKMQGIFVLRHPRFRPEVYPGSGRLGEGMPLGSLLVWLLERKSSEFWVASLRPGCQVRSEEKHLAEQLLHWARLLGLSIPMVLVVDSERSVALLEERV